jgi:hypothetical protein
LITALAGTFLPWLQSGGVRRNSYTSFGVLRRLIGFHGAAEAMIRVWPLLGVVCAMVVLVALAGLWRSAAGLGLLVAAWSATVAGAALARDPVGPVRVHLLGPIVTVLGSTATAAAAIVTLISQIRPGTGGTLSDRAAGDIRRSTR